MIAPPMGGVTPNKQSSNSERDKHMSAESLHKLLLSAACTAAVGADTAEIAATIAFKNASIAVEGNQSRKKRERLRTVSIVTYSEFMDAEMDAGRAVEALRQFEEDNDIQPVEIEPTEFMEPVARTAKKCSV